MTIHRPDVVGQIKAHELGDPAHPASAISVIEIGSALYDQLQEIHNLTRSAGHLDGGEITDAGGGNIAVAAGQGFIRALNDDVSTLFAFNWPAPANIAIPSNTIRHVRVDYNGGSPVVTVSAAEDYDYRTGFPIGFVVNEAGTLFINETPHSSGRFAGRLARRNAEVDGRSRANALGGIIIGEPAAKAVSVTAGATWFRGIRETFSAFDSNGTDRFDAYYRDGVGGFTKELARAVVPDGLYDDNSGGPLPTIGNNNYGNYWFYLGPANNVIMVYGRGDHNSLASAQAELPPGDLPLRLQIGSLLVGRFIMRRTPGPTFTVTNIESAFATEFVTAPVSDHGALAGLGDDDHPQYALKTDPLPSHGHWFDDGSEGPEGPMGPPGIQGPAGATGPQGPPGSGGGGASVPGLDGDEGPEGPIGPPGLRGATGATGSPGPAGAAGAPGAPGMDGDDSERSNHGGGLPQTACLDQ